MWHFFFISVILFFFLYVSLSFGFGLPYKPQLYAVPYQAICGNIIRHKKNNQCSIERTEKKITKKKIRISNSSLATTQNQSINCYVANDLHQYLLPEDVSPNNSYIEFLITTLYRKFSAGLFKFMSIVCLRNNQIVIVVFEAKEKHKPIDDAMLPRKIDFKVLTIQSCV